MTMTVNMNNYNNGSEWQGNSFGKIVLGNGYREKATGKRGNGELGEWGSRGNGELLNNETGKRGHREQ